MINRLITIIGGSGFIGTRLCSRLSSERGRNFLIVDKNESASYPHHFCRADVRSLEELTNAINKDSIVINLAAEHRDDVYPLTLYEEVNVQGARNICSVAISKNVNTIIFTSSVAVYGFAPKGTNELGRIAPFNDYGRTKWMAEQIYLDWQAGDPNKRALVIIRPTVVFGEANRGNVFNLFKQIASKRFIMVGNGLNCKSLAYVENVAAFLDFVTTFSPGVHIFNYVDKPDFTMNEFVSLVKEKLGMPNVIGLRIPRQIGILVGGFIDFLSRITCKKYLISAIRVKKFTADSTYESAVSLTGFKAPVSLESAIERTIQAEFIDQQNLKTVFYTE